MAETQRQKVQKAEQREKEKVSCKYVLIDGFWHGEAGDGLSNSRVSYVIL